MNFFFGLITLPASLNRLDELEEMVFVAGNELAGMMDDIAIFIQDKSLRQAIQLPGQDDTKFPVQIMKCRKRPVTIFYPPDKLFVVSREINGNRIQVKIRFFLPGFKFFSDSRQFPAAGHAGREPEQENGWFAILGKNIRAVQGVPFCCPQSNVIRVICPNLFSGPGGLHIVVDTGAGIDNWRSFVLPDGI